MPRNGRLHIPGGCYHVMGRGLERRYIFHTDTDKLDFLERLEKGLHSYRTPTKIVSLSAFSGLTIAHKYLSTSRCFRGCPLISAL